MSKSSVPDQIVGTAQSPDIYIDGYSGALVSDGIAKIRLYRTIMADEHGGPVQQSVGLLTLSLPTLVKVHAALGGLVESLKQDGVINFEVVEGDDD